MSSTSRSFPKRLALVALLATTSAAAALIAAPGCGGSGQSGDKGGEGKKQVVLLRYMEGSASTAEREAGFLEAVNKHPDVFVASDNQYAGATQGEAQTIAMNMLDTLRKADGIFCPNESSTLGLLQALRQDGIAGKKHFVGFDASPQLIEALKNGEIEALVAQNPTRMGYLGVKTCVEFLRGQKVPERIDSGAQLVTKANLNSPEVQTLLGGGGPSTAPAAAAPAGGTRLQIAVIPKGTTHAYWKSVEAGARQAGDEMGVDIIWKGPLQESDRAAQIAIVEQFVSSGVNGIVLAPLDDAALKRPVDSAMEHDPKIPVVIIDSALKGQVGKDFVSFVATDNHLGGVMGGEELVRILGAK